MVAGRVTDPSDAVVSGAVVTATSANGATAATRTNADGHYLLAPLSDPDEQLHSRVWTRRRRRDEREHQVGDQRPARHGSRVPARRRLRRARRVRLPRSHRRSTATRYPARDGIRWPRGCWSCGLNRISPIRRARTNVAGPANPTLRGQYDVRVDHNVSSRDRMFVRASWMHFSGEHRGPFSGAGVGGGNNDFARDDNARSTSHCRRRVSLVRPSCTKRASGSTACGRTSGR